MLVKYYILTICVFRNVCECVQNVSVEYVTGPMTWAEANSSCALVRLSDISSFYKHEPINIINSGTHYLPIEGWITEDFTHTHWIEFQGCKTYTRNLTISYKIPRASDPILYCYERCNSSTFALYGEQCGCIIHSNMSTSDFCAHYSVGNSSITGSSNGLSGFECMCLYQPLGMIKVENEDNGHCIAWKYSFSPNAKAQFVQNCDLELPYSCDGNISKNIPIERKKFWDAATKCQEMNQSFAIRQPLLSFNKSELYWGPYFKRPVVELTRGSLTTRNHCISVQHTSEAMFLVKLKKCDKKLPGLCSNLKDKGFRVSSFNAVGTAVGIILTIVIACVCAAIIYYKVYKKQPRDSNSLTSKNDADLQKHLASSGSKPEPYEFCEILDLPDSSNEIYNVLHNRGNNMTKQDTAKSCYDTTRNINVLIKQKNDYDIIEEMKTKETGLSDYDIVHHTASGEERDPK